MLSASLSRRGVGSWKRCWEDWIFSAVSLDVATDLDYIVYKGSGVEKGASSLRDSRIFTFSETLERLVSLSALMYYMLGSGTKYVD